MLFPKLKPCLSSKNLDLQAQEEDAEASALLLRNHLSWNRIFADITSVIFIWLSFSLFPAFFMHEVVARKFEKIFPGIEWVQANMAPIIRS